MCFVFRPHRDDEHLEAPQLAMFESVSVLGQTGALRAAKQQREFFVASVWCIRRCNPRSRLLANAGQFQDDIRRSSRPDNKRRPQALAESGVSEVLRPALPPENGGR